MPDPRLLPAPAGLVPRQERCERGRLPAPRARGVGPQLQHLFRVHDPCSLRPRGWSRRALRGDRAGQLLPAPAGMDPPSPSGTTRPAAAPRARGVGPASPSTRPPRTSCSPRARGWSQRGQPQRRPARLLPAPAGLVPSPCAACGTTPAAPRTRGIGPTAGGTVGSQMRCSPRPRGWSRSRKSRTQPRCLLPAPAGLLPPLPSRQPAGGSAPRACGVGPGGVVYVHAWVRCSPRPRGWPPFPPGGAGGEELLPAPAGLVPRR